jgi:type II secretory pathway pseudopilin PulG
MGKIKKRAGFTLIEVTIAIFILIVIIVGVLMLLSSSYANLKGSEAKNIAKNIGTYTVEYIRSRNVTADNNFINTLDWFNETTNTLGKFPGLVDLGANPLMSNPSPLKPNSTSDTINIHPALPSQNYNITAFYSSIQGYVSLANNPADFDPSSEDGNAKVVGGKYYDKQTDAPYIMRFPLLSSDSDAIKNFSAGSTYIPMIYTTDPYKINSAKPEYDPHYTNDASKKANTMNYNGFRVLTSIAARAKEDESNPGYPLPHVQYFDVKVTVLWITGGNEHEYSLATQIVTY